MKTNEKQTKEVAKAIFNLKRELGAVKKSAKNPFFKSKYADLNAHLELLEPLLAKNSLILTQPVITNGQKNIVSTEIYHVDSGESITSQLTLPETDDLQKVGGAITYARRYTLNSFFAMQSQDDDGETAMGRGKSSVKSF